MVESKKTQVPGEKFDNLTLNVSFSFDEQWEIGPATSSGGIPVETTRLRFPPGGGLTPRALHIGPVHLQGLSPEAVAKIVRERAEDMATLSEAIAIANIQFREALESLTSAPAAQHKT